MQYVEDVNTLDEVMTTAAFGNTVPERMGGISIGPNTDSSHLLVRNKIEGDELDSATGAMNQAYAAMQAMYESLEDLLDYLNKMDT